MIIIIIVASHFPMFMIYFNRYTGKKYICMVNSELEESVTVDRTIKICG